MQLDKPKRRIKTEVYSSPTDVTFQLEYSALPDKPIDRNSCIVECTNGYKQAVFYIGDNNNFLQVSNRPKAEILATTPHIDFVDADLKELAKDVVNSLAI